jgi:hypothetical protein
MYSYSEYVYDNLVAPGIFIFDKNSDVPGYTDWVVKFMITFLEQDS